MGRRGNGRSLQRKVLRCPGPDTQRQHPHARARVPCRRTPSFPVQATSGHPWLRAGAVPRSPEHGFPALMAGGAGLAVYRFSVRGRCPAGHSSHVRSRHGGDRGKTPLVPKWHPISGRFRPDPPLAGSQHYGKQHGQCICSRARSRNGATHAPCSARALAGCSAIRDRRPVIVSKWVGSTPDAWPGWPSKRAVRWNGSRNCTRQPWLRGSTRCRGRSRSRIPTWLGGWTGREPTGPANRPL